LRIEIVADESVNARLISRLQRAKIRVHSIREHSPGSTDRQVLAVARDRQAVVVTEDSDFGELIFAYGEKSVGVVYLRYAPDEELDMANALTNLLSPPPTSLLRMFTVLTPKRIRQRRLPRDQKR